MTDTHGQYRGYLSSEQREREGEAPAGCAGGGGDASPQKSRPSILIIGGGFAGIAAAVELAGRGYPVTLIERRRVLGGRASSFLDRTTGQWVDNGQHILMGCYTETLALLRTLGVLDRITFQENLRVDFRDEKGNDSTLSCPPFPAPWHLVGGLLRLRHLPWADRLQMHRVSQGLDGASSN
ncbi:MAG: FAD-dependent oxidoreductase, partial [Nitrospirae bacterium]|nr:FAD-dependent oxidoreductase [Nitrospirota bacterium]